MRKFDLRKIMKRAWDLLKKGLYETMSAALKRSWKVEKSQIKAAELKAKEAEKQAAKEAKQETGIKLVDWFEKKKFDETGRFLNKIIGIEKETAKAYLLKVEVAFCSSIFTETIWAPKSCTVIA